MNTNLKVRIVDHCRVRNGGFTTRLMKHAVKAIADIYKIELNDAARYVRRNPLLGEEIPIYQELANLEEAMQSYWSAHKSFEQFPKVHQHLATERHQALKHCIGLIVRMIRHEKLAQPYDQKDIALAVKRLARLVCDELAAAGREMDRKTKHVLYPLLTWRQRLEKRSGRLTAPLVRVTSSNRFVTN